MNDEARIKDKLLDNQRELIAALQGAATKEQVEAYQAIAETQYMLIQSLLPAMVEIAGPAEFGPITMQ